MKSLGGKSHVNQITGIQIGKQSCSCRYWYGGVQHLRMAAECL